MTGAPQPPRRQVATLALAGPAPTDLSITITAWLDAKAGRSGSQKTLVAYRDTLAGFRATLAARGLDLDGQVSPSTYNQRLAILSSFYTFAARRCAL